MPDGWSEPWPRREVDDLGAWEQFVEQLDPAEVQRERISKDADLQAERFGSRQHHEMVHAHGYIAAQLRADREAFEAQLRRDALDEVREYNRRERSRINQARSQRGHAA